MKICGEDMSHEMIPLKLKFFETSSCSRFQPGLVCACACACACLSNQVLLASSLQETRKDKSSPFRRNLGSKVDPPHP